MVALSLDFKDNAKTLKRNMMWKNYKLYIIIGIVLILVVYFAMVIFCGGFTLSGCF